MAYDSIPDAWRDIGKAVKKDLVDRIHNNLEDLNNRVTNVEGSISVQIIANQLISKDQDQNPVGTLVWSSLTEANFNTEVRDGSWVTCDGQSVSGTDYGTLNSRTNAPDVRGKFLRMRAHGTGSSYNPSDDVANDTYQADNFAAHTHVMNHGHAHTITATGTFASSTHRHGIAHNHQWGYQDITNDDLYTLLSSSANFTAFTTGSGTDAFTSSVSGNGGTGSTYRVTISSATTTGQALAFYTSGALNPPTGSASTASSGTPSGTSSPGTSGTVTNFSGSTSTAGANDTRPHNITEDCFIKVNRNYIKVRNGYLLWRAPQALTINQVVLTPVTQGTSGTLTVDVKQGPLTSISTSIFTSTPSLVYSATTAQTGTINPTNAVIAAGDYVRLDITATQSKLQAFHIMIAATPT